MNRLLTIFCIFSISSSVFAYEYKERPFISTTTQDGKTIGLFATDKDFEGAEKWDINNGEPPLSISEAVSVVTEWAKEFYPRFDSVVVERFHMQRCAGWNGGGNWLYVFDLSPIIDGNKLYSSAYMAAVTMSGKVIEPRILEE